jgi:hypothetical protein
MYLDFKIWLDASGNTKPQGETMMGLAVSTGKKKNIHYTVNVNLGLTNVISPESRDGIHYLTLVYNVSHDLHIEMRAKTRKRVLLRNRHHARPSANEQRFSD